MQKSYVLRSRSRSWSRSRLRGKILWAGAVPKQDGSETLVHTEQFDNMYYFRPNGTRLFVWAPYEHILRLVQATPSYRALLLTLINMAPCGPCSTKYSISLFHNNNHLIMNILENYSVFTTSRDFGSYLADGCTVYSKPEMFFKRGVEFLFRYTVYLRIKLHNY